ncbi:aminotransferase class III-fold pyridoxal phosphate-dependent enzyme [Embleya hyalina]|uniref:aminotransferase class III-fold pyridoxal phosphate-dependent enzyme n=1 Tax=Embleya hyalina TaxID=516124 RepID=UPI001FE52D8B|nr:aminotransferase class III-fold pyridoxal phosphate-dependent enzyme [Embleya hyalina]
MWRAKPANFVVSAESTEAGRALFHRARRSLAGGTASPGRITIGSYPYPLYIARGKGAHIWDVDGNEYVDYLISYGCAVVGYADSRIVSAVVEVSASGTMFGAGTVPEIELAETVRAMQGTRRRPADRGVRRATGRDGRHRCRPDQARWHVERFAAADAAFVPLAGG